MIYEESPLSIALANKKFHMGRMISGSKSGYRKKNPDSQPVFNARIWNNEGGKWWGDLDLILDSDVIQEVANECKTDLYVLTESSAWDLDTTTLEFAEKWSVKIFKNC
jgi:hypothetical protein